MAAMMSSSSRATQPSAKALPVRNESVLPKLRGVPTSADGAATVVAAFAAVGSAAAVFGRTRACRKTAGSVCKARRTGVSARGGETADRPRGNSNYANAIGVLGDVKSSKLRTCIKITHDILEPSNKLLCNAYQRFGRCTAVVEQELIDEYRSKFETYFNTSGLQLALVSVQDGVCKEDVDSMLTGLYDSGIVQHDEPLLVVGSDAMTDLAALLRSQNRPHIFLCTAASASGETGSLPALEGGMSHLVFNTAELIL
eukprot:TRINITY_DN33068_c0_g1_i1.p1 TRINITY_DN33068_c0_g1~~TRINITY_DN33068_c0_g1_i1.p1  ORF type:complete len:256 (-),score=58.69 TRINITY_DN33068_c0_g1_i1:110-877(-)